MKAQVRTSTKIFYGIGEIAITAQMVLFGLFILFFYNSVMKLPATLVGLGSALGLLWDALVDPYIGYRSDRCTSRLGRRHLYMLVGALTMGVSFWLLLSPPQGLGTTQTFLWLLGTTCLLRLSSAVYRIPYLSLGAELSSDYHERTIIVGIRSFFGLWGALGAGTLSFILFFPNTSVGVDPKLDYASYPKMGLAFGIAMSMTGLCAVLGTLGHRSSISTPPERGPQGFKVFLQGFGAVFRNPAFRKVWLSFSLFFLAVVVNSAVAIHYLTWYVRIADSETISTIQACFYLGAISGVLFWVWLSNYVDKHRLYLASILATTCLLFGATLLFGEGGLFRIGDPTPLFLGNGLAGFFVSALWVLPGSMLADVTDQDEINTGLRREGILFGLLNFGEKIGAGLSLLIVGVLIEHFVQLVPGQLQQQSVVSFRIGLLYGVLPGLLVLGAAVLIRGYPLNRHALLAIQTRLRQRKSAESSPERPEDP